MVIGSQCHVFFLITSVLLHVKAELAKALYAVLHVITVALLLSAEHSRMVCCYLAVAWQIVQSMLDGRSELEGAQGSPSLFVPPSRCKCKRTC